MKKHLVDVDRAVAEIRELTVRPVVQVYQSSGREVVREVKTPAIELMLGRARRVLVAAEVPSASDGYASTTPGNGNPGGGKGGGRRLGVSFVNDQGKLDVDLLPTSSTEAAAIDARWSGPDPVAKAGREVNRLLLQLAADLRRLERELDNFDGLQSTAKVADPPMCWVAQVRYKLVWDVAWEPFRSTDFAGHWAWDVAHCQHEPGVACATSLGCRPAAPFDEPRQVCPFVYQFVRREKRLPERAEMLAYLAGPRARR